MSTKSIINAFEQWKSDGQALVMVTVYATDGSTYSKTGHRIIITNSGDYHGLVSGGCLEGDLAEHARTVFATGEALAVTYDLRDEADEIWGMGIGCNGVIKVLLQRLDTASGYEPFQSIAACHLRGKAAICATIVHSEYPELPGGATLIDWGEDYAAWQIPDEIRAPLRQHCAGMLSATAPQLVEQPLPTGNCTVLYATIKPIPRLLILGAGPDAVPLVNMATEIGWQVTVADHRAAYLEEPALQNTHDVVYVEPTQLEKSMCLDDFSAVVAMSHHLQTDRSYLEQLASSNVAYIGVLGPRARRDRLISELKQGQQELAARLKGPVGLGIGADSPESIALSIMAEIHQTISGADD